MTSNLMAIVGPAARDALPRVQAALGTDSDKAALQTKYYTADVQIAASERVRDGSLAQAAVIALASLKDLHENLGLLEELAQHDIETRLLVSASPAESSADIAEEHLAVLIEHQVEYVMLDEFETRVKEALEATMWPCMALTKPANASHRAPSLSKSFQSSGNASAQAHGRLDTEGVAAALREPLLEATDCTAAEKLPSPKCTFEDSQTAPPDARAMDSLELAAAGEDSSLLLELTKSLRLAEDPNEDGADFDFDEFERAAQRVRSLGDDNSRRVAAADLALKMAALLGLDESESEGEGE
mmetsp:Transcript_26020/g.82576  ORF Transcript_26020/g.82576 Transcript_26020/m.82576 type:complete len:300 (+) Transcript_26020:100-999(+)